MRWLNRLLVCCLVPGLLCGPVRAEMLTAQALAWHALGQTEGEGSEDGEGIMEGEGAIEGEGAPEGEGALEGEGSTGGEGAGGGEGEGAMEGEGEGAAEGEGEPEGEPACTLETWTLTSPTDGATWYLSGSLTGLEIVLAAEGDCDSDVSGVNFYAQQQGGGPRQQIGATDTSPPFERRLSSFFSPPLGQSLVLSADAARVSDSEMPLTDSVTVDFAAITEVEDDDSNGFPDDPFALLGADDDRWFFRGTLAGEEEQVVTWMRTVDGETLAAKQATGGTIEIELASPENAGQRVAVTIDPELLNTNELGLFVVRFAPTLRALVGQEAALEYAREPGGQLRGSGQYVLVSVLVSSDDGVSFDEISSSRLGGNPVELALTGLTLDTAREYTLARHAATLQNLGAGLGLYADVGSWRSLSTQSTDYAANTISGTIVQPGVFAPYFVIEEGEFCPFGFCAPPIIVAEILALFSFVILLFVPGGVGGGESPCFVATAAYGTPMAAEIGVLRELRDEVLLESGVGTALVDAYYRVGPVAADWIAEHHALAALARVMLTPVVALSQLALWSPGACTAALLVLALCGVWRRRLRTRP